MTAGDDLAADRAAALALTPVSRETLQRLDALVDTFLSWQSRMNLVSRTTLPHLWTRHIADSLQLIDLAPNAERWVDLGSGGGFPGLVVACALAGRQGAEVHLVESQQRKAAYLSEAARLLQLPVMVHAERIETFSARFREKIDVVSARALAPMAKLLGLAAPFMEKGAKAIFPKGQDVDAELTEAAISWHIEADLVPSKTDPKARIVCIRRAKRRKRSGP